MATSKLYTFKSLFGSKFPNSDDNKDDIEIQNIVIPIIQRDYAQGRHSPEVNRIRKNFLNTLYDHLANKEQDILDFVYGDVTDKGNMIPLDGQQRLTTLFLLYWYAAKHESIAAEDYVFLNHFTYETRVSAREFFASLLKYGDIDFSKTKLSLDIINQNWFPYEWKKDPTVMSALTMIDAIHDKFNTMSDLWERLDEGLIAFYFLPIKDMGLTDDLYIKMNSRGKPLTQFEHFKAQLESSLKGYDADVAKRIIRKIDLRWTDMLWPYRGDNNIIDDEFMKYFAFIVSIIYYKQGIINVPSNPFDIIESLFSVDSSDIESNISYLEDMFDIWCGIENINGFFSSLYTKGEHNPDKIKLFFPPQDDNVNIFNDCCRDFGIVNNRGIRAFPWPKFLTLYAVTEYLQHADAISLVEVKPRLRAVNNIINNSEFEMREDRMPAILRQIDNIVVKGCFDYVDKSLNKLQVDEENHKKSFLTEYPEKADLVYMLEDHYLLRGTISVVGLENVEKVDKFYSLFNGSEYRNSLVGRAMLAIGDYSQLFNWRYQIGTRMDASWMSMFHTSSRPGFDNTKQILNQLLDMTANITDDFLNGIINGYLANVKIYDWRYYVVKYDSARPERYGMYYWVDYKDPRIKLKRYDFIMMFTEISIGGRNWMVILKILFDLAGGTLSGLALGDYAYGHEGDLLTVQHEEKVYRIKVTSKGYEVLDGDNQLERSVLVSQNDDGLDIEDRIVVGLKLISDLQQA